MTNETLQALQDSIAHWKRMRDGVGNDHPNAEQCALCRMFNSSTHQCAGCPVKEKTGLTLCKGTPYAAALHAWDMLDTESYVAGAADEQRFREAAEEEVKFLESLLPNEKANESK